MKKPTVLNDLILCDGEAVIVNGLAINSKMIDHLTELSGWDEPSNSAKGIATDLLFNKMHQINTINELGDQSGAISETSTLLNIQLIGLLTEMGLLDESLYSEKTERKNAYTEFMHENSEIKDPEGGPLVTHASSQK